MGNLSQNWLPWQSPLSDHKINDQLSKHSHTSTIPTDLVKINLVDSEIAWLEGGKWKKYTKKKHKQNIYSPQGKQARRAK